MFCKSCGAELTNEQLFCPHCGAKNEQPNQQNSAPGMSVTQQMPNYQMPLNQASGAGQVPPVHASSAGQVPPVQPTQGGQVSSNQLPPRQVPPNMAVHNQIPNYQSGPKQMPPYQQPLNQTPPKQMGGPGMIPPMPPNMPPMPPYTSGSGNKKNKALLPIIIGAAVLIFIIAGIIVASVIINYIKHREERVDTWLDDSYTEPYIEDSSDIIDNNDDVIPDDGSEDLSYNLVYSYLELPDVISIDTDSRFAYYDYYLDTDVITYSFLFNNTGATEDDFYTAVDDYCSLLMDLNGFYYEEDFSLDQYNETGANTDYYSKDNFAIGITASVEDTGWYAYIDIYDLSEAESEDSDTADSSLDDYSNYTYYLEGRDSLTYDLGTEVIMDNGMAFYLNEVTVTDLGDGTAQIDCNMNLAANNADTYLYTDDFLCLPMDQEGYIIGDASLIEYVVDSTGEYITAPYLLDTEYYYNYTVSFIVPAETATFSIYGTNLSDGYFAGPVYYIEMEVTD